MEAALEHRTATATPRPMRVAYLVDPSNCPDELLDAIFAESYSRWGGRRSLIAPATEDGIDERYQEWMKYFDADVIYSFVSLNNAAIADMHEQYAPAYFNYHFKRSVGHGKEEKFLIELPLRGLESLSVLPAFRSRAWAGSGRPKNVSVFNKFYDRSESKFIEENFGFLSKSFHNWSLAEAFPEIFTCITLAMADTIQDAYVQKNANSKYETDENRLLETLGQKNWVLPLVNLSEMFTSFLDFGVQERYEGMNIVVGDSVSDRLLFWNGHHRYPNGGFSEITSLRIPKSHLEDFDFLKHIFEIVRRRGVRAYDSRAEAATLRSCSLDREKLEEVAGRLRQFGPWLSLRVETATDHAICVPKFPSDGLVSFSHGNRFNEPEVRASTVFRGNPIVVPRPMPMHISEALPPAQIRYGNWMIDVRIERAVDHCKYVNKTHVWLLPRRVRLEQSFHIERDPGHAHKRKERFIRPMRTGIFGLALNLDVRTLLVSTPDDFDAIHAGICNIFEWAPFDRRRENASHGRPRFYHMEISDKGRYILGVLNLFESLPSAFSVLMNGFWRKILQGFGASPVEKNIELPGRLIKTLRRRLKQQTGALIFETDEQIWKLAYEALRIARNFRMEQRFYTYKDLEDKWLNEVVSKHAKSVQEQDNETAFVQDLQRSIQYLCQCNMLFQGQEWRCQRCFNRNWVSIDALQRSLTCEICGLSEAAPVYSDWHFRANPFLLEAYREHGTEAAIWALWRLTERAQDSFYFVPSIKLWVKRPEVNDEQADAEIDAVAVVDGNVYLVEATTSRGLSDKEIEQLTLIAERIRPNVMFIACTADTGGGVDNLLNRLKESLPLGVRPEVLTFNPDELPTDPFLL